MIKSGKVPTLKPMKANEKLCVLSRLASLSTFDQK